MSPGRARDAGNGCSLTKSRNAAWRHLPRNPSGRACFCDAAFLVAHLEQPNFTPRALPRAKTGSGAAANETSTDPSAASLVVDATNQPEFSVVRLPSCWRQATRSGDRCGSSGGVSGGKPWAARAASQWALCWPSTQDASNSRQVLERCSYIVQRTPHPTSPSNPTHRAGLVSVPRIATRNGLTCTVAPSGTVPPDEAHSPQKKDTRKCAQQAPHVRQELSIDMEGEHPEAGKGPAPERLFYSSQRPWEGPPTGRRERFIRRPIAGLLAARAA